MLERSDIAALRRQKFWSAAFCWLTYAWVIAACKFYFRYRLKDIEPIRERLWKELDAHDGPVIWAANHLTLIDSFLVFWAVFPWHRALQVRFVPWSTPEYKNYYHLGGPFKSRIIRVLMYLCRCIPFLREGEDAASVKWRESAYQKCLEVLKENGAVFVYPEAGRSRSGWLEKRKPKDFLGRMALEAPRAKFLCVYLRGDRQLYTTAIPDVGEEFRVVAKLVPAVLPGETAPRQVSQRLFDTLAEMQDEWFRDAPLLKNCAGNDVVDLQHPSTCENIDPGTGEADSEWIDRHMTAKERKAWEAVPAADKFRTFWKYFAAKEACHKALVQSGIVVPLAAYTMLEVDLFRRKVMHRPTGIQLDVKFTDDTPEVIHCLSVLRGGWVGDDEDPGDMLWQVEKVPAGERPSSWARERCLELIASSNDEIGSAAKLAFGEREGVPVVLRRGKSQDWGVSLSHSGRWAAWSFMIS